MGCIEGGTTGVKHEGREEREGPRRRGTTGDDDEIRIMITIRIRRGEDVDG
jgi:hypothetical protein